MITAKILPSNPPILPPIPSILLKPQNLTPKSQNFLKFKAPKVLFFSNFLHKIL